MRDALAATLAALVCAILVVPMKQLAVRTGMIDRPRNDRLHREPIPYLGGGALMISVIVGAALLSHRTGHLLFILAAAVIIGAVGIADDAIGFGPLPKLLFEVGVSAFVFSKGVRLGVATGAIDAIATTIWLVILTNSFNLIDNMDGALGSVTAGITAAFTVAILVSAQPPTLLLAPVVLGAVCGFLLHNWSPARIFMGDAGSLFLGFVIAGLALEVKMPTAGSRLVALPLLVAPALLDTTLVVISRVRTGRPIYRGSTDHTTHRLLRMGLGVRSVAVGTGLATFVTGCLALAAGSGTVLMVAILTGSAVVGLFALWGLLRVDVYR